MLDDSTWMILVSIATIAAAGAIAFLLHAVIYRLLQRFQRGIEGSALRHARRPGRALFVLIGALLVVPLADIPTSSEEVISRTMALAIIAAFGWLAVSLFSIAEDVIAEKYPLTVSDNFGARALQTRVRVLRSAGVLIVVVITASVILMSFPSVRQLGVSLLASAGLLALVVGMAARPALENLIAGLQIAMTQPIKLDDVVILEGEYGRIEEITATYVVVRIWDSRRLVVPLNYFITNPIENWTRRTSDLLGTVYLHVDYRVPVDEVRHELHEVLLRTPLWDEKVWNLQVTNALESGVELRALMSARSSGEAWDLRCYVREELVRLINERWPDSLPRLRTEMDWQDGRSPRMEPQPSR
jgi:small-conductance mechanosensitive channel